MSASIPAAKSEKVVGAPSPVAVFQGYDSVTGRGLSTALVGETETVGGTSSVKYRVCTDLETLSQSLEIDQSLSVGFGPFGGFDEKLKFVHNLKVTTNSVSIVVHARHTEGKEVAKNVSLRSGMKPPSGTEELREFFRGYGDTYLAEITRGGEYYAVYTYYSQTREEQNELTVEMKAHGIFEGGNVDASLQTKLSSFNSSTKTRAAFDQNISGIRNPKLPSSDNIISFALSFPSIPLDAPAIIGFETTGYERVPKFGSFQPIAKNRDFFVGDGVIDGLTKPLVQVQELENQIGWIRTVYATYGYTGDDKLSTVRERAIADHRMIDEMIRAYENDPTQTFTAPKLPSLEDGTPVLQYSVKRSDAYGGNGGGPFDDVDPNTSISQLLRISGLQLRTGGRVDKLIVDYENMSSKWTKVHGGDGGDLGNKIILRPGQFVTQISGRSGGRVDHLSLTTSNGDKVEGGGGGGSPFTVAVPTGSFVLGFAGRSGEEIDKIQFIFGSLSPATWQRR